MTPPPAVADPDWQVWLAQFPATFPDSALDPAHYRKRVETAAAAMFPDRLRLTAAERSSVVQFRDRHHAALAPAAEAGSLTEAIVGAGIAAIGAGALLNPALALAGGLMVAGVALYQLAKIGFQGAGDDRTRAVMDTLAQIARIVA